MNKRPFDKFPIEECTYGTPHYITLEEKDRIINADLSSHSATGNTEGYIYIPNTDRLSSERPIPHDAEPTHARYPNF
ncbi:hypothetical protein BFAG_04243 [Bacteroides fragilis 3_1_12]|uniref:Uncharacterized protein n=1 Tax=Bacteroides fragilis 3_1_12 TaxID=457424 RepID=A0ABN0BRL9_BACFG|nr:hypothetical protein BFAG_04243 [Bacteroides fragilis 3_1_12]